jgi:hypothetical protein
MWYDRHVRKQTRRKEDALYRGDNANGVAVPDPTASTGIVEHILYLDGPGRATPFTSTTEDRDVADHFAGKAGHVWNTDPPSAVAQGATHIPLGRLLSDLKGSGRGECRWKDPWEVAQARVYAERWREHLLNWRDVPRPDITSRIKATFRR